MKVFLVGGFLGSGKTTAIQQAAICLQKSGEKAGVVTNDQGEQLVDTQFMRQQKIAVEEVTNGCFCCNFQQLLESINSLRVKSRPDVLFAESVGSCTDLTATVIKPLYKYSSNIDVVLSIFADVRLLCTYLLMNKDIFYGNMNYIYQKQLEEADIIVVNKIDTLNEEQMRTAKELIKGTYPKKKVLFQNSLDSPSVQEWLSALYNFSVQGTRGSLDINYDDYAAGEAEMAWYDSKLEIVTLNGYAFEISSKVIAAVYNKLRKQECIIGHLKFFVSSRKHQIKVSFTTVPPDGDFHFDDSWKANKVSVLINARVKASPMLVDKVIADAIMDIRLKERCSVTEKNKKVFQPGYPKPTYRIDN